MIIGKDILPRGTGIVTRRPTLVQLNQTPPNTQEYGIFNHKKTTKYTDFDKITDEIR